LLGNALLLCLLGAIGRIEREHAVDLSSECIAKLRSVTAPNLDDAAHKSLCNDAARAASRGRKLHEDLALFLRAGRSLNQMANCCATAESSNRPESSPFASFRPVQNCRKNPTDSMHLTRIRIVTRREKRRCHAHDNTNRPAAEQTEIANRSYGFAGDTPAATVGPNHFFR
jgi:hypothetical protein